MDQSLKVMDIKYELIDSTSIDRVEVPIENKTNSIKQKCDCLVQPEIHIKTEPYEDESGIPGTESSFYEMCHNDSIKFEMDEPMIKFEYEDTENGIMKDPLDICNEFKAEEKTEGYFPPDWYGETSSKIERIERKEEGLSDIAEHDSHGSESNSQDQWLVKNKQVCNNKKHTCYVCNKTFRWKSSLDDHFRIHSGEKPYTCEVCQKAFYRKSHLDRHMIIHSGEKPHFCDVCMKAFNQKEHLATHKLIHTDVKPFSCDQCNKSFTRKQDSVKHKQIHIGNKPFSCEICYKTFAHKPHLITHKRRHTGEKPYSCDHCNKLFAQKQGLNYHKRTYKH